MSVELEGVAVAIGHDTVVLPGSADVAGRGLLRPPVNEPAR
jgi:hypothetical protein